MSPSDKKNTSKLSHASRLLTSFLQSSTLEEWIDEKTPPLDVGQALFHHIHEHSDLPSPSFEHPTFRLPWKAPALAYILHAIPLMKESHRQQPIPPDSPYLDKSTLRDAEARFWTYPDGSSLAMILDNPWGHLQSFLSLHKDWKKNLPVHKMISTELKWQGPRHVHFFTFEEDQSLLFFRELLQWLTMPGFMSTSRDWLAYLDVKEVQWHQQTLPMESCRTPFDVEHFLDATLKAMHLERLQSWAQSHLHTETLEHPAQWRETLLSFMYQSSCLPYYDSGLASFFMIKPQAFSLLTPETWKHLAETLNAHKQQHEFLSLSSIETLIPSHSDHLIKTVLPTFLLRYHKEEGAFNIARKITSSVFAFHAKEKNKKGLAAQLKTQNPNTKWFKEYTSFFESSDFLIQYSCASAIHCALQAQEEGFSDLPQTIRTFIQSLPALDEFTIESFGWLARLLFDLAEGFVEPAFIIQSLESELQTHLNEQHKTKRTSIENEWSTGTWGIQLVTNKAREYLKLVKIGQWK